MAQVADALTKLHDDGDLLRAVCRQALVTFEVAGACERNVDTCDTDANRDLTRNPILSLKPCHVIQPSGSRTSLRYQCFFCLVHIFVEFCYSLGFGTTEVSGDP